MSDNLDVELRRLKTQQSLDAANAAKAKMSWGERVRREMVDPPKPREVKKYSLDDIETVLNEIAQDPNSGADRIRALKMLASMNSATVTLPEPLDFEEITDRYARMFKATGRESAKRGYEKAFAADKRKDISDMPPILGGNLSLEERRWCRNFPTLKHLLREFKDKKRPGSQKGYPQKNRAAQHEWCTRMAIMWLQERKELERERAATDTPLTATEGPAPDAQES